MAGLLPHRGRMVISSRNPNLLQVAMSDLLDFNAMTAIR